MLLLGQAPLVRQNVSLIDYAPVLLAAVALLLVGMGIVIDMVLKLREKRSDRSGDEPANELLTDFRRMKEQGAVSDEEFQRIKGVLGNQIRVAQGQQPVELPKLDPMDESSGEYEWIDVEIPERDQPKSGDTAT